MAWAAEQAVMCGGCGHPLDETLDPSTVRLWEATSAECQACAAKHRKQKAVQAAAKQAQDSADAWRFGVHRIDDPTSEPGL